ncbi:MAG: GNAT family N-acetyltransferase [bacterium]
MMTIRPAKYQDQAAIQGIYETAFAENERALVTQVALALLTAKTRPPSLSFVAEINDTMVGHIAFSPVSVSNESSVQAYILVPLAVSVAWQRQGIGTKLVEYGKQVLVDLGVKRLFVYGDPNYYGKFGFSTEQAVHYQPPYPLQYPQGWQALLLNHLDDLSHGETPTDITKITTTITCIEPLCDARLW